MDANSIVLSVLGSTAHCSGTWNFSAAAKSLGTTTYRISTWAHKEYPGDPRLPSPRGFHANTKKNAERGSNTAACKWCGTNKVLYHHRTICDRCERMRTWLRNCMAVSNAPISYILSRGLSSRKQETEQDRPVRGNHMNTAINQLLAGGK